MDLLLRVLAFVIGGGVLAYLLLLYLGALYAALVPMRDARQIAPIQTIVDGKISSELGAALAQMLLVHVAGIRQQLQEAAETLSSRESPPPASNAAIVGPAELRPIVPLQDELPNRLQESFTIQLNVGGVELTGLANWLFRQFASTSAMRIVIETVGDKRNVYGNFDAAGTDTFVIRLDGKPSEDAVLDAIAHRMAHRAISRAIPQLGALRGQEFKDLLSALGELSNLNLQIARGREPAKEFDAVLTLLDPLSTKVRGWSALARITGEVAERANNLPRAKELYMQAVANAQSDAERQDLQRRLERVSAAILVASTAPSLPAAQVAGAKSAAIPDEAMKRLLSQVGVTTDAMPKAIRIAIVGGAPSKDAVDGRVKIVGPPGGTVSGGIADYYTAIMRTVGLVAPNVDFVFSRRSVTRPSEIVAAIEDLLPEKPQLMLMPVRGVADSPADRLLLGAAAENIVVIMSAGNEGPKGIPFAGTELLDKMMVVSAVDTKGMPAVFTQRDPKSFWTPGVDLPNAGSERYSTWSGTGPAAAIAAGVVARVLAKKSGQPLTELLAKLRQGAAPLSREANAPPVLNAQKTIGLMD